MDEILNKNEAHHTFTGSNGTSWIDHVIVNNEMKQRVIETNIIESPINTSDHFAIEIKLIVKIQKTIMNKKSNRNEEWKRKVKIDWQNSQDRNKFNQECKPKLERLKLLIIDNTEDAQEKVSNRVKEIVNILQDAENEIIQNKEREIGENKIENRFKRNKRWWNRELEILKSNLNKQYKLYKNTNSEFERDKYKSMKREFRKTIRRSRFEIETKLYLKINKTRITNKNQFWRQVKNKRSIKKEIEVDIETLKINLKNLFKENNSSNEKLIQNHKRIKQEVDEYYNNTKETISNYQINRLQLKNIIKSLTNNKSRGYSGLANEHFKYSLCDASLDIFINLFETMFKFGKMPCSFNIGKIIPIIKDHKKSLKDVNNIRPITISDPFAIIFEKLMLQNINEQIKDKNQQFGFVKRSSTQHAAFVVKETANYYLKHKSCMYISSIDSSKAFDTVWRYGLFHKLINKCKLEEWRLLWLYYLNSMIMIQIGDNASEIFKITGGVKQGGPLSPKLYNIYVADLINKIEISNMGAIIEDMKINIIMYADDIILISPLKIHLIQMIKITLDYMENWKIKINLEKTNYMTIGIPKIINKEVRINETTIQEVNTMKYLGIIFNKKLDSKEHLKHRNKLNMIATYSLYNTGLLDKCMDSETKSFIYKTYCRPTLLYGLELATIGEMEYKLLRTDESILLKRIISTTKYASTTKAYLSLNIRDILNTTCIMKLKLWHRLLQNKYTKELIDSLERSYVNHDKSKEKSKSDKSLYIEIKEFQALFDLKEFKLKNIKSIEEKLQKIEEEAIKDSTEITFIKYCIDNRYKEHSLHKTLSKIMDYRYKSKENNIIDK
jgi:hypothetical protein